MAAKISSEVVKLIPNVQLLKCRMKDVRHTTPLLRSMLIIIITIITVEIPNHLLIQ